MSARIRRLETKLSNLMGPPGMEPVRLEAPADIDNLQRRIVELEQTIADARQ
ncbi:hypothetical protein ACIHCQ_01360 [Streptomyces sp. NPDC052236]|uniref:hypothetical protein n=1 Tax=Streptomyces sp. NPDC052236 TaxID=3365686 RepID=UPI0037D84D91